MRVAVETEILSRGRVFLLAWANCGFRLAPWLGAHLFVLKNASITADCYCCFYCAD